MKLLIWSSFVFLTLLWSGMAILAVNVSDWAAALLSSGGTVLTEPMSALGLPAWLQLWVSPELIAAMQATVSGVIAWVGPWLPSPQTLSSLMSVLVWLTWGVGMLIMLVASVVAHGFVSRR
jgi:hypothetical protein